MFILVLQSETEAEETLVEEEHVELFTTAQTKMAAATSDFGYNLFRALASQEAGNNVFLSPISVSAVLTQLSMGDNTQMLIFLNFIIIYSVLMKLHVTLVQIPALNMPHKYFFSSLLAGSL